MRGRHRRQGASINGPYTTTNARVERGHKGFQVAAEIQRFLSPGQGRRVFPHPAQPRTTNRPRKSGPAATQAVARLGRRHRLPLRA